MTARVNFADPAYEPTDEDLGELVREAFSGLREARAESLRAMRARIAAAQDERRRALGLVPRSGSNGGA
jgi:hypothetical protein